MTRDKRRERVEELKLVREITEVQVKRGDRAPQELEHIDNLIIEALYK